MELKEAYSRIPMRTWRYLGVNDAKIPKNLPEVSRRQILAQTGTESAETIVERAGASTEIQIQVEKNATFHLTHVQLAPKDAPHASRVKVHVEGGARFLYTGILAGGKESASELLVDLVGKESDADVWTLYFGDGERTLDLNYVIRQQGEKTTANMQVRGALKDKADKIFRGTLDFIEGAKGAKGKEDEEVMLLSDGVRNRSVPLMLSHEGDVDGHHAVSVGKMDEEKLFYLMTRGLSLGEAQRLVVEANFNPVLDRLQDPALKEEIGSYLGGLLSDG